MFVRLSSYLHIHVPQTRRDEYRGLAVHAGNSFPSVGAMSTQRKANWSNLNPAFSVIAPKAIGTCGDGRFRGCQRSPRPFRALGASVQQPLPQLSAGQLSPIKSLQRTFARHCAVRSRGTPRSSLSALVAWTGYTCPSVECPSNDEVKGVWWHHQIGRAHV